MKKRPLAERIENYLWFHSPPADTPIPIHPDDVEDALKKGMYDRYDVPYRVLGSQGTFGGKGCLNG